MMFKNQKSKIKNISLKDQMPTTSTGRPLDWKIHWKYQVEFGNSLLSTDLDCRGIYVKLGCPYKIQLYVTP